MSTKIELENVKPMDIEKRSFEIITEELAGMGKTLAPGTEPIVKRCIHTSADFDYADNLYFSEGAVEKALADLKSGAVIVTDTKMAWSGINKNLLGRLGGEAFCFMSDTDVAAEAKSRGVTRAIVCMERGAKLQREGKKVIFAVGNAPTALVRLYEMIENKEVDPSLIIGVPVGFVNVVPSKELIIESGVPCIVARGRKGGSNIAACICNALMYMISTDRGYS
ncbi:MAG: precorrin-8X methylmutase [Eubacterium sp.]|nr:precorrin-8X methylmutase [Eubacterium sp.]